jgi:hypothetical protein
MANDRILLAAISDLLINLSAGWFGVAVVLPLKITEGKIRFWTLLIDISLGILTFGFAVILRRHI